MPIRLCPQLALLLGLSSSALAAPTRTEGDATPFAHITVQDPQTGQLAVTLNQWIYFRSQGHSLLLRAPPGFVATDLRLNGPALLAAFSRLYSTKLSGVVLRQYDAQGRMLWSAADDEKDQASLGQVWPRSSVLSYSTSSSGAFEAGYEQLLDLRTGEILPVQGEVLAGSPTGQLLLVKPGPSILNEEISWWLADSWKEEIAELPYRVLLPGGAVSPRTFRTPPRPGCGAYQPPDFDRIGTTPPSADGSSLQLVPLKVGIFAHAATEGDTLYARREDACGPFTYVFRWSSDGPPEVREGYSGPSSDPIDLR